MHFGIANSVIIWWPNSIIIWWKHIFQHYCNWNIACIAVAMRCQGIHLKNAIYIYNLLQYNLPFYVEHHALLSIIGLFQIFQMIPVPSAIRAVCFRQCHLVVTAQQEVTSLPSWLPCQNAFTKWLPPWRKGRIICLWIKSVFGKCLHVIWF